MNEFNTDTALQFLELLDTRPVEGRIEHWCGFADRKDENLFPKSKFAPFEDMVASFVEWGQQGYGIALAINELTPNTETRRSKNGWVYQLDTRYVEQVTRIRALFADCDECGLPEVFPIEPTMIVETSAGKFHVYWCVDPSEPLPVEEFKTLQASIAGAYGSDPSASDLNRVLRLPGSLHRKSMPRLVRITEASGTRYGAAALRKAFRPAPPAQPQAEPWDGVILPRVMNTMMRVKALYGPPNRTDGGWDIECPWASEHTSGTSKSASTYWPASTENDGRGAFKCFHAHCQNHRIFDFNEKMASMPAIPALAPQ